MIRYVTQTTQILSDKLKGISNSKLLHLTALAVSILFVLISGFYIAYRSSVIHSYNHDHLVDSYMFESYGDFKGAIFPAPHTFFVKWPLFAISGMLDNSSIVFKIATLAVYFVTIACIIGLITYICRKNYLRAALVITLYGLILFMIPAQSSPGVLAPVNMAMITTRNLEFILYIVALILMVKSKKLISWTSVACLAAITILGLTDKLFLLIGLVAAVIHAIYQVLLVRETKIVRHIKPLVYFAISYLLVIVLSLLINASQITTIYKPLESTPFNFVSSVSQAVTAFEWAVQATLVNFGVTPFGKSIGVMVLPSIVNGCVMIFAGYAAYRLYFKKVTDQGSHGMIYATGYWLALSTIASIIIYTLSDHYLENDLRYMGIASFAGIIAIALYMSRATLPQLKNHHTLILIVGMLMITPIYGMGAKSGLDKDLDATKAIFESKFSKIETAIDENDVKVLIAEYWYVSPIKLRLNNTIEISPLLDTPCVTKHKHLTSSAWYVSKNNTDNSALHILKERGEVSDKCLSELVPVLGKPDVAVQLSEDGTDELWIYNYDIRSRLQW